MDPHTRATVYNIQRAIGTRTANEIRAEDDKPPIVGGDEPMALPVLERMVTTTRAIPKSLMPLVEIEAKYIANLIEKMETDHPTLVNPDIQGKPPLNVT